MYIYIYYIHWICVVYSLHWWMTLSELILHIPVLMISTWIIHIHIICGSPLPWVRLVHPSYERILLLLSLLVDGVMASFGTLTIPVVTHKVYPLITYSGWITLIHLSENSWNTGWFPSHIHHHSGDVTIWGHYSLINGYMKPIFSVP